MTFVLTKMRATEAQASEASFMGAQKTAETTATLETRLAQAEADACKRLKRACLHDHLRLKARHRAGNPSVMTPSIDAAAVHLERVGTVCNRLRGGGAGVSAEAKARVAEASGERRTRAAGARKAAGTLARPSQRPGKHERKALERLRKQFDPT